MRPQVLSVYLSSLGEGNRRDRARLPIRHVNEVIHELAWNCSKLLEKISGQVAVKDKIDVDSFEKAA